MSVNQSKFDKWWNSPEVKQKLGAAYSIGASIVILGAMFKILHLPAAGQMLGIGMSVEAFLFALGIFDQPHKDYDWDKVYNFDRDNENSNISQDNTKKSKDSARNVSLNYTESINDEDVIKLSEGIKNLSITAQQFAGLSNVVGATDRFVSNIDNASNATSQFISSQESLNNATTLLKTSYKETADGMDTVDKNTKQYAIKVEQINKNLSSINSIYEIQLKNIQAQSEGLTKQTEKVNNVTEELNLIVSEVQKMKTATTIAANESENFKSGTVKLAKQITDLNQVYGNMLNALS